MKILLFNDNPVVRKLVALSAQKTKDDLKVIWSVDEIEESDYDLLIIDDALYSDEAFMGLKELVTYKSLLLMATRGQAIPAGFDNVINKPFLPTDLVDMFVQIEKRIFSTQFSENTVISKRVENTKEEPIYAIHLEETLPDVKNLNDDFEFFDLSSLDDEIDLKDNEEEPLISEEMENFDEIPQMAVLDKEEVQEVQNLLDDTEGDEWGFDEDEIIVKPIKEPIVEEEVDFSRGDFNINDHLFDDIEEPISEASDSIDDLIIPDYEEDILLNDEELDNLESQIQDAVNNLEAETLDKEVELDDLELNLEDSLEVGLTLPKQEADEFDELDMLSERELKLAIGEEVDDEPEVEMDDEIMGDLDNIEPLEDEFEEVLGLDEEEEPVQEPIASSHAEGVEALQALLKALSNEDVAKSLKGLNISININFGNEK
ncbi:hypothetical protein [Sulfuricurvum sp.]|uniref:hypothetical protein n=1 Tax=Sulfuricurvum sp. TaxID=2025608 RepID=UPI003BB620A4